MATDHASRREKLVRRIRALMALAESHHPHEAAAALQKARALMDQYGVNEVDVAMADVRKRTSKVGRSRQRHPLWLVALVRTVRLAFSCESFFSSEGVVFVGVAPAEEIADYAFTVLRRQLTAARAARYRSARGKRKNRVRAADEYALGWVFGVRRNVEAFAQPVPQVVKDYIQRHERLVEVAPLDRGRARDSRHLLAGVADGATVQLQHGVTHVDRAALACPS